MKKSLAISAILLFAVLAGIGYALTPPPPPPPPVNQNIGIYDTSIAFFQTNGSFTSVTNNGQMACRACHTSSGTNAPGYTNATLGGVDTRHHGLAARGVINPFTNTAFGCQDCHPTIPGSGNGILLDHSCTDCHNSTSFWGNSLGGHVGNLSRPHHFNTSYDDANIGNPVQSRQCKVCHGSFVDNYNDSHYIPSYNTDPMITPYAKWKVTDFATLLGQPLFASDSQQVTNKEWGGCESCHLGTINTTMGANGQFVGSPILPNHDSHHQTILDGNVTVNGIVKNLGGRTPGATCSWCHVILPGQTAHGGVYLFNLTNQFNTDPSTGLPEVVVNTLEVRNSTIEQMDAANASFEPGTVNVTINGTGCEKCHSVASIHNIQFNYQQNGQQGLGHINNNSDCNGCHNDWVPADSWTPGALIPYVDSITPSVIPVGTATTLTITGSNFVNDPYTSVVTIDGVKYTPTSITDTQIVVNIPALSAGVHQFQLVKGEDTLSKLSTLIAVSNPTITSAKLAITGKGKNAVTTLTISGNGFGTMPASNAGSYVSVSHAGNQIASSIVSWSNTQIKVKNSAAAIGDTVTVMNTGLGEAVANITK